MPDQCQCRRGMGRCIAPTEPGGAFCGVCQRGCRVAQYNAGGETGWSHILAAVGPPLQIPLDRQAS